MQITQDIAAAGMTIANKQHHSLSLFHLSVYLSVCLYVCVHECVCVYVCMFLAVHSFIPFWQCVGLSQPFAVQASGGAFLMMSRHGVPYAFLASFK